MEDLHLGISAAVSARGGRGSVLTNGLSKHVLPPTVTFSTLGRFHELVQEAMPAATMFLGTVGGDLVMSARVVASNGKKKRPRDEEEVDIGSRLARLHEVAPACEIARVKEFLERIYRDLRGSRDEPCVMASSVEFTKLQATDKAKRAVVAVRIHSGIPLPLHRLKSAMGGSWGDGAITTLGSIATMACSLPPISAEGKVALEAGNVSWSFLTSLPILAAGKVSNE